MSRAANTQLAVDHTQHITCLQRRQKTAASRVWQKRAPTYRRSAKAAASGAAQLSCNRTDTPADPRKGMLESGTAALAQGSQARWRRTGLAPARALCCTEAHLPRARRRAARCRLEPSSAALVAGPGLRRQLAALHAAAWGSEAGRTKAWGSEAGRTKATWENIPDSWV